MGRGDQDEGLPSDCRGICARLCDHTAHTSPLTLVSLLVHLLCASLLSHFTGEWGGLLRPRKGKGLVSRPTASES